MPCHDSGKCLVMHWCCTQVWLTSESIFAWLASLIATLAILDQYLNELALLEILDVKAGCWLELDALMWTDAQVWIYMVQSHNEKKPHKHAAHKWICITLTTSSHVFTTVACLQGITRYCREGMIHDTLQNRFPNPKVLRTTLHWHYTTDMITIPPPTETPERVANKSIRRTDDAPPNKFRDTLIA